MIQCSHIVYHGSSARPRLHRILHCAGCLSSAAVIAWAFPRHAPQGSRPVNPQHTRCQGCDAGRSPLQARGTWARRRACFCRPLARALASPRSLCRSAPFFPCAPLSKRPVCTQRSSRCVPLRDGRGSHNFTAKPAKFMAQIHGMDRAHTKLGFLSSGRHPQVYQLPPARGVSPRIPKSGTSVVPAASG